MKWYQCEECGEFFREDEAGSKVLDVDRSGWPYGPTVMCCPVCGNESLADADECEICGEPIPEGERFCSDCKSNLKHAAEKAISEITDTGADREDAIYWLCGYLEYAK